uniref:Peptidase A1 domain-containing protein n=1 Tax=Astatotilapia calliptera TaxID=8154 RepID=A0A3P8QLY3_ASTCA
LWLRPRSCWRDYNSWLAWSTAFCHKLCFLFDPGRSSTYRQYGRPLSMTYGTGSMTGFLGYDTVTVAGLTVTNQIFSLSQTEAPFMQYMQADGILGLAYPSLTDQNLFSLSFFPNAYCVVHYSVSGNGQAVACNGGCEAIVDTGTSLIVSAKKQKIWRNICNNIDQMPDVTFNINGQQFTLPASSQSYGCLTGFSGQGSNLWILGNVFLGQYYSIFNRGQKTVGLAKAR